MSLIRINNANLEFGHIPILKNVNLSIGHKEIICLVGRNGCGKSSLLKVINGTMPLDSGTITLEKNVKIATLQQDPPKEPNLTLYQYIAQGLEETGRLLEKYNKILQEMETNYTEQLLNDMQEIQQKIDDCNGWDVDKKIIKMCQLINLKPQEPMSKLSGGMLRKADLGRALIGEPNVLLLDEPTNHLDINTILWLENFLENFTGSIVFVSHDRAFIRKIANKIVDIDRGNIIVWDAKYDRYLELKKEKLREEERQNELFDKKLAKEEVWIRQGIKARRTRNEGRVRALKEMRQQRKNRIEKQAKANIKIQKTDEASSTIAVKAKNIGFSFKEKSICENLNLLLNKKEKIALIGPNGCGKSTIIKLLLGHIKPDSGYIKLGNNLNIGYFDQTRMNLDESLNIIENVSDGKEMIEFNGKSKHILSYLQDFLFSPERALTPVSALSGGEKNRILLAKLFLQKINLLVLDEPTNDLDVETIEIIENLLIEYQSTAIIVSHDRDFLDETITSSLWFKGDNKWEEYVGSYNDAISQGAVFYQEKSQETKSEKKTEAKPTRTETAIKTKKLSYKDQRYLEQLPDMINEMEDKLEQLQAETNASDFYKKEKPFIKEKLQEMTDLEEKIATSYQDWEELEQQKNN